MYYSHYPFYDRRFYRYSHYDDWYPCHGYYPCYDRWHYFPDYYHRW